MDIHRVDDVFSLYPELLVHPVSCTGLSKNVYSWQLKRTWPQYFQHYTRACTRKHLFPSVPDVFEFNVLFGTKYIVTLPIKEHWQGAVRPDVIKPALLALINLASELKVSQLGIPNIEGPPEGWLTNELVSLAKQVDASRLKNIYLFQEG